jgi:cardiolipin synthase
VPRTTPGAERAARLRARDLLSVPGLLSLSRLPLAASFPFVVSSPPAAFAVLAVAAATDILDGWWARRFRQMTATGAALDPLTDKVFAVSVGISLVSAQVLTAGQVLLLGTRELGEILLVLRCATGTASRRRHAGSQSANGTGKLVTVLQFAAVTSALFEAQPTGGLVAITAVAGAIAAVLYGRQALRPVPAPRVGFHPICASDVGRQDGPAPAGLARRPENGPVPPGLSCPSGFDENSAPEGSCHPYVPG